MQVLRFVLVGTIVMLASALPAIAQRVQVQPKLIQRQGDSPLLTADAIEKLKFSTEQKDKYTKIETDYKDKAKASQEQLRDDLKAAIGDRAKLKEIYDKMQSAGKKIREDHLAKVEPILTVDQKKVFEQVKQDQARPQPNPGGIRIQPIGGGGVGQVLPPAVQQRLNLSDEQKKQIEAIQKEVEAKILKVLTDDQKKQFEDLKKGGVPPRIRPIQPNPAIRNAPAVVPAPPANVPQRKE
jgi:Spy/CpxP family protein refolding chaperone